MKISTITFNHAHNHGSMLQTYALQQFLMGIGEKYNHPIEYEVIDYDTDIQRELYCVFKRSVSLKNCLKNLLALYHYKSLYIRHKKFEDFFNTYCLKSRRYVSIDDLMQNPPSSDAYISGSDQIWNVRARDFSCVYYLSFVKQGKKISYAASFGPLKIDWEKYDASSVRRYLNSYDFISVREKGSADNVETLIGSSPEVHVDPTFLLTADEWRKVQSSANYNDGKYILLYCLEPSKQQLKWAETIGRKLGLPIVVTRYNNKNDWFNPFVHMYETGPRDFLSLIDHASLVLSSSFHGTAFSIIYHKPFYVFNGLTDNRISSILERTDLRDRSIETRSDIDKVAIKPVDAIKIDKFLNSERQRSAKFLVNALELF